MKVAIVLNGISNRKRFFYRSVFPELKRAFDLSVFETTYAAHAYALAEEAASNHQYVLAAGGDGTLHQCVNGVMRAARPDRKLPAVGIIPLGTGNDFARLCGIKPDAAQIIELIRHGQPRATDLGMITCQDKTGRPVHRYFINVCSLGMGPEVVRRLEGDGRSLGPKLTYLKAIVSTFFTHRPQVVQVSSSEWSWEGKARVIGIANGRTFGNGLCIAPDAFLDDGRFSTFIAGELPLIRFLYYLQKIKRCARIVDPLIEYNAAETINLTAPAACAMEAEGEFVGFLPAKVSVQARSIRVLR